MMEKRTLALDVGDRRIGMAISDLMGWTAQPLYTIHRTQEEEDLQNIVEVIKQHDVGTIVCGLPKNMDGTIGFQGEKTAQFMQELQKLISPEIKVVFQDERLSSKSAKQVMHASGTKKKNKKNVIDTIAAVFILETYLMRKG